MADRIGDGDIAGYAASRREPRARRRVARRLRRIQARIPGAVQPALVPPAAANVRWRTSANGTV